MRKGSFHTTISETSSRSENDHLRTGHKFHMTIFQAVQGEGHVKKIRVKPNKCVFPRHVRSNNRHKCTVHCTLALTVCTKDAVTCRMYTDHGGETCAPVRSRLACSFLCAYIACHAFQLLTICICVYIYICIQSYLISADKLVQLRPHSQAVAFRQLAASNIGVVKSERNHHSSCPHINIVPYLTGGLLRSGSPSSSDIFQLLSRWRRCVWVRGYAGG